jgi:hypothetical protein
MVVVLPTAERSRDVDGAKLQHGHNR